MTEADLRLVDSMLEMEGISPNSIDACVTDPPYLIGVLEHEWDDPGTEPKEIQAAFEAWSKLVFRSLKPGALFASFGSPSTYHRMVCAFEDVGFEIRDTLCWIHQGHPHGQDVGKAIDRHFFDLWLKELGAEYDAKVRRVLISDYVQGRTSTETFQSFLRDYDNQLPSWGVPYVFQGGVIQPAHPKAKDWAGSKTALKPSWEPIVIARKPLVGTVAENALTYGVGGLQINECLIPLSGPGSEGSGRFPSNVLLEFGGEVDSELVIIEKNDTLAQPDYRGGGKMDTREMGWRFRRVPSLLKETSLGDGILGPATRFYVIPKPSPSEKDEGLPGGVRNTHPTVKPISLMRHIVKLVVPMNGVCMDPFMGSGTTGVACISSDRHFIGFEKDPSYYYLAQQRVTNTQDQHNRSINSLIDLLPDEE